MVPRRADTPAAGRGITVSSYSRDRSRRTGRTGAATTSRLKTVAIGTQQLIFVGISSAAQSYHNYVIKRYLFQPTFDQYFFRITKISELQCKSKLQFN